MQVYGVATVLSGGAIALQQGSRKVKSDAQGRAVVYSGADPVAGLALLAAGGADVPIPVLLGGF